MDVVMLGSAGFAGSARIMADCALVLSRRADRTTVVTESAPFHLQAGIEEVAEVALVKASRVASDAVGAGAPLRSLDSLSPFELAEAVVSVVRQAPTLVWSHYLFPYGAAAMLACEELLARGVSVRLWLTPAGSDIWQIAPQIPVSTRRMLQSSRVSKVLTYSRRFAREVEAAGDLSAGSVELFTPAVGAGFEARRLVDCVISRQTIGIPREALVLSSHGNMRPVKAIDHVVQLADEVARRRPGQETWLLLAGPGDNTSTPKHGLQVARFGVLHDLRDFLWASDVEVNLSKHDSFNMSIAEAMTSGTLPLTTDVAGVSEHIQRSGAGLTVPLEEDATPADRRYNTAVDWLVGLGELSLTERVSAGGRAAEYARIHFSRAELERQLVEHLSSCGLDV